ncbi:hypothetical protein niasHT_023084 [Heterodera trifolii]|uniref:Uncharacterized protein n=1 Tax=Heterodera trifolii TaxID=157864 RepID=A0ABD2KF73_9BILA
MPVMEFTNRKDCLKVSQWVSFYAKNNTDEKAKAQLIKVKQHIFYGEKLDLSDPPAKKSSKKLTSLNEQKTTTPSKKTDEMKKKIKEGAKKFGKKVILKKEKKSKRTKNHKEKEEEEEEEEEKSSSSSSSEVSDQQSNEDNFWSGALLGSCFTGNGGAEDGPTTYSNDGGSSGSGEGGAGRLIGALFEAILSGLGKDD